jgi:hypothetical protein
VPYFRERGRVAVTLAVLTVYPACASDRNQQSSSAETSTSTKTSGQEWFVERAQASGLDFVHFNGMSGEFYYPEIMAPGVGLFDYDNDGDLDVYIVQGQMLGKGKTLSDAVFPPNGPLKDRLFRNNLVHNQDGTRTLRFTDVTEASLIDVQSYGMGVATGDFNNDGWIDLYRTGLGRAVHGKSERVGRLGSLRGLRPGRMARSLRGELSHLER